MLRQRLRHSAAVPLGRAVLVLCALALIFYGTMVILLALKVGRGSVNAISGYRDAYDYLAGLQPRDVAGNVRGILAAPACCCLKQIPRPYLTRHTLPCSRWSAARRPWSPARWSAWPR